jgi:hypothetical protein
MPDHIKLILRHAFFGFLIALAFVAGLLALNVANLWHLVTHTAEGPIAVLCTMLVDVLPRSPSAIGADRLQDHVDGREKTDEDRAAASGTAIR